MDSQKLFTDGEQYQRDVAAKAAELGPNSPEFAEWCRQMDAWRASVQEQTNG